MSSLAVKSISGQHSQTVNRRSLRLQASGIMKTWNYIALVLFSTLAICVLGKFEAEEPLDRGTYCLGYNAVIYHLKAVLKLRFSTRFFDSKFIGWGETIEWKTLENGLKEAKKRYIDSFEYKE